MFRPINIEAVANGWIVQVGCQRLVFTSAADLTSLLAKYLGDPEGTEKSVIGTAVNIRHTLSNAAPAPTEAPKSLAYGRQGQYDPAASIPTPTAFSGQGTARSFR